MAISRASEDPGFALSELLVAAVLALSICLVLLDLASGHFSTARVHPATVDIVERGRAAAELLTADLSRVGAGASGGRGAGPLSCCLPALQPRRIGVRGADPPGTARSDVVTMTMATSGAAGGRLQVPVTTSGGPLVLVPQPPCPTSAACGLGDTDTVVVFDEAGQHDYFRVVFPPGGAASVVPRQPAAAAFHPAGAMVVRVETHTYWFDSAQRQLRHYDGYLSDVPAIDDVASMRVEYWGVDQAPTAPRPLSGIANCLYDAAGQPMPWPGASFGHQVALVPIRLENFRDGPWCGTGANRFDADLLRVRRLRLSLVLEGPDDLRLSGSWFARPGRSMSARRVVPDLHVSLDVTPRNLNAGR